MSSTKVLLALCLVAFVAACAKKEEEVVYVDPAPLTNDAPSGKYK